jgi:hypothetical protein
VIADPADGQRTNRIAGGHRALAANRGVALSTLLRSAVAWTIPAHFGVQGQHSRIRTIQGPNPNGQFLRPRGLT